MRKIASPNELARELMSLVAYVQTGAPERKRIAHRLRELADGVEVPRVRLAAMGEAQFWDLTESYGWGARTTDYKAIKRDLMRKISPEQADDLQQAFYKLKGALSNAVANYLEATGSDVWIGDSFDDLLSHIIGMGKQEYTESLRNPQRAVDRLNKGKYTESFSYALPSKADYESLQVGKYVTWAREVVDVYEALKMPMGEVSPQLKKVLPKVKGDLMLVLDAMKDFARTKDYQALLAREDEIKRASEAVGKALAPLRSWSSPEGGTLEDAIHQASNKWMVWNLVSDLREYLA